MLVLLKIFTAFKCIFKKSTFSTVLTGITSLHRNAAKWHVEMLQILHLAVA